MSSGIRKEEAITNEAAVIDCLSFMDMRGDPAGRPSLSLPSSPSPTLSLADVVSKGDPNEKYGRMMKVGEGASGEVFVCEVRGEGEGEEKEEGNERGNEGEGKEKEELRKGGEKERDAEREGGKEIEKDCVSVEEKIRKFHESISSLEFSECVSPVIIHAHTHATCSSPSPAPFSLSAAPVSAPASTTSSSSPSQPFALDLRREREKANTLMDLLTRSGSLDIHDAVIHVINCTAVHFEECILDVLCQRNVNPIERVIQTVELGVSVLNERDVSELVRGEERV